MELNIRYFRAFHYLIAIQSFCRLLLVQLFQVQYLLGLFSPVIVVFLVTLTKVLNECSQMALKMYSFDSIHS